MATTLEIDIEPSSNQSHEQTPVGGASSVPQDESRGLKEMTPQDLNSLKKQVCEYADKDRWKEAKSIFNEHPDMVRIPLTDEGDTALHVAVKANSISFVKGLVNLMTPQDLQIQNKRQYTAFFMAAMSGNSDLVQIMIEINQDLPLIKSEYNFGMLPVHCAVNGGQHEIVQVLSSKTLLDKMDSKDIEELFFLTIEFDMFDVATKLFKEYPDVLAIAKSDYGKKQTALEMLLRKPSKSTEGGNNRGVSLGDGLQLLQKIWFQLETQLGPTRIYDWIGSRLSVLVDALESGNVEALIWLLENDKKLCELLVDSDKQQNILHYAARKRHNRFFVDYILKFWWLPLDEVDKDGNNILHLAAYPLEIEKTSSTLRPTTQMTRDVKWFKKVEKNAPRKLRTMRNGEGKTPKDVFSDEHKDLSRAVKKTSKAIAESGMLVAALGATVAFAAAVTAPGEKTNPWFTVFILANAAALFTSSTSILSFLSYLTTSSFGDSGLVIARHPSVIIGLTLLLISIVTMDISFVAASFLMFEQTSKWTVYVVASMGVLSILLFPFFLFSIFDHILWSRFYCMSFAE